MNLSDLIRLWLHETHRVYGDKLTEDKDIDAFLKMQVDLCKKNFEVRFFLLFSDNIISLYEHESLREIVFFIFFDSLSFF